MAIRTLTAASAHIPLPFRRVAAKEAHGRCRLHFGGRGSGEAGRGLVTNPTGSARQGRGGEQLGP